MGSLMAGWDSPFHDPRTVELERNRSLTKEEIEAYRRSNKKDEDGHDQSIKSPTTPKQSEKKYQRSNSLPLTNRKGNSMELDPDIDLEKLIQKKGWWTRSTSAFLNEPPVIASEGTTHKYVSQYHVAAVASSASNPRKEISA